MKYKSRGRPDFILLFSTFLLVGFGLIMVFSASSPHALYKYGDSWYFLQRQIIFAVVGWIILLVLMNIPFARLKALAYPSLLLSIVLLVLVLQIGTDINGAKRWIFIGPFSLQPGEFVKLSLILFLAVFISKKQEQIRDFKKGLAPVLVIVGLMIGLILLEPDLGTAINLLGITFLLVIIGGANMRHIFTIGLVALPLIVLLVIFESYRFQRITAFLNPWDDPTDTGYQLIQSLFALSRGGLSGAGLGQSFQKFHYLPEAHTDFIFAIIGEELGFAGIVFLMLVLGIFIVRGFVAALTCEHLFGMFLGLGIVIMFSVQIVFNLGAVTGSLPITGVTLPFISYGGSSLLVSMAGTGILLSISRENNRIRMEKQKENRPGFRQTASM
ncbi:putative lipid II flippase FtsW [Paenibacillus sp. J2TS4]|uniref:putative lipid II flippase FtsW n=1 Tax=Paenibacillus sp. J2TS4 TaxID=2807194 RepID=UPI001B226C1D|nr:putative lipid II flippase FtsW [Paenibacillus sp. J2TS4]GIP34308.1 cell division protein FtsW [Paenibacillus sp. J2TS4]